MIACLVIILGFTGVAAHALWSQTATGRITVSTGSMATSVNTTCHAGTRSARVTWSAAGPVSYTYTVSENAKVLATETGPSVTEVLIGEGKLLGLIDLGRSHTYEVHIVADYGGTWKRSTTVTVTYSPGILGVIAAGFRC